MVEERQQTETERVSDREIRDRKSGDTWRKRKANSMSGQHAVIQIVRLRYVDTNGEKVKRDGEIMQGCI